MNQENDLTDIDNSILEEHQANPIKRNLAGIIDAAIILAFIAAALFYLPQLFSARFNNGLYILLVLAVYRLFFILMVNGTPGMLLFRIKLLNDDLDPLSLKEKILAAFFILFRGVAYYNK